MTRSTVVKAVVSLLLCSALLPSRALTQEQSKVQTFGGKIVSQNAVRFVLKDYDNDVWYHIDDQQKAGNLLGKYVLITGTFDGLTGTIRVQRMVEATPDEISAANAEKMKLVNESARAAAAPPASTATNAPGAERSNSTQETVGNVPTPRSEAQIPAQSYPLLPSQSETSDMPLREVPATSLLGLPEEAVSASSTVAISSRRSVKVPPGFNPQTQQPAKNLVVGRLLKRVSPFYPDDAKEQRIEGTVRLHAVIGEDGTIQSVQPVSGPQLLVGAAVTAVREWRYGPTIFEGHPIQVQDDIRLVFRLPN
jgi:TonB family protein